MCGIVGYTGEASDALVKLTEGLKCVEYRGYDSAGVAMQSVIGYNKRIFIQKSIGGVAKLEEKLPTTSNFSCGIGHTRWATHGKVSVENAHPHYSSDYKIAIVHNGVIDNADFIRDYLIEDGYEFVSETDSEVIVHLLHKYYSKCRNALQALNLVADELTGTYGIVAVFADILHSLFVAKNGSPILIGIGKGENFIASDASGIAPYITDVVHMKDGESAVVARHSFRIYSKGNPISPAITTIEKGAGRPRKGDFEHFMLKEIHEQPASITRAFSGRIRKDNCNLGGFDISSLELSTATKVVIIGCGTSYHAGLIAADYIERFARIDASVKMASEFSLNSFIPDLNAIYIAVSQSGETFDTIEAVKELLNKACSVYGIINTVGSTLARLCGKGSYIHAGHEVAVASTKAFTSQLAALSMFAIMLARANDMDSERGQRFCEALKIVPQRVGTYLTHKARIEDIKNVAKMIANEPYVLFLGRGVNYPVAMEGALKLKEIAYIPCDAYAGGEMKHGPIAMIEKGTHVIAIVDSEGPSKDKMMNNIQEVKARGARVHVVSNNTLNFSEDEINFWVTGVESEFTPFINILPLQLLAYYTAIERGLNIDKPRNLAKSVTVG